MKKLAISLCFILAFSFALTGCASKRTDEESSSSPQTVDSSENITDSESNVASDKNDVKPQNTEKPKESSESNSVVNDSSSEETSAESENTEKTERTIEPENTTEPENNSDDYSKGKYAIETETDTIVFEDGKMIIHYHEDENGKDSLTAEDGTIEYSEYYGKTPDELIKEFESKKLAVGIYKL